MLQNIRDLRHIRYTIDQTTACTTRVRQLPVRLAMLPLPYITGNLPISYR